MEKFCFVGSVYCYPIPLSILIFCEVMPQLLCCSLCCGWSHHVAAASAGSRLSSPPSPATAATDWFPRPGPATPQPLRSRANVTHLGTFPQINTRFWSSSPGRPAYSAHWAERLLSPRGPSRDSDSYSGALSVIMSVGANTGPLA